MRKKYDYLLVGAGLYNAVFAYLAKQHGKRCLVIDKRSHVGGNIYCEDVEGIHVHRYGPHIFHTNNKQVWEFVNQFVSFNRFTLCPVAYYKGRIFNLPFNMNTFYQMWGTITPAEAMEKIRQQSAIVKGCPKNLEEQAILQVGEDIYQTLIKGYTEKQWGRSCTELPPSIIQRIPVRFTYDNNYYNDCYQGIPEGGYNKLIDALLNGIECKTNCDFFNYRNYFNSLSETIVYSGAIDEYFGYRLGHLAYRSLRFEQEAINNSNFQGNAIVNYTDIDTPFTRIVEHKYFDINNQSVISRNQTVITREFPVAWTSTSDNDPYYPINDYVNSKLYDAYKELADAETNVIFGGRLAEYKYLDMHQVIERALQFWL